MRHLLLPVLATVPFALPASLGATETTPTPDLTAEALRAFDLVDVDIVRPTFQGQLGAPLRVVIPVGATQMVLDLTPYSLRSETYSLLEQQDDGSLLAVPAPEPRTYRGVVVGEAGAVVAASWLDDGLYARIRRADGSDYWIQPMATHLPQADAFAHVLYANADVVAPPFVCGTTDDHGLVADGTGSTPAATAVADIACDADYEFFKDYGSSGAVQNRIESVVNTLNLQYESEVAITHNINAILVRASKKSNPYKGKGANRLLNQLRNDWESNHDSIDRDTTHLFTGISVAGGTIGIAWVGVICHSSYAYGLAQSDFNNNFSCATDLSAHELGHNWNASHCSCTSNTMNPYITCANTFNASLTRPVIAAHRDSRGCLE